jgi:hypothetical protein
VLFAGGARSVRETLPCCIVEHDDLPPHLIRRRDVAAWLADSVNQRVTYHNTTPLAAAGILRLGVRIEASRIGSFGQGFYTATTPDPFFGEAEIAVAVRLLNPLMGHLDAIEAQMEQLTERLSPGSPRITPSLAPRIRRHLLAARYDGLVIRDGGGDGIDHVIALVDGNVRVIVDR